MMKLTAFALAIGVGLTAAAATVQAADCGTDTLCKVKEAGVLKIGTKDDYVPWSYRASDGSFKGMEVDVGKKIAEALGVKAEFVKVTSANRFEFLAQGQIEPPRLCRRPQLVRSRVYDKQNDEQIFS